MKIDLEPEQVFELVKGKPCMIVFFDKPDGDALCDGYTDFVITKTKISPIKNRLNYATEAKIENLPVVIHSTNPLDADEIKAIEKNPLNFVISKRLTATA